TAPEGVTTEAPPGEGDDDGGSGEVAARVYFARDEKIAAAGRTVATPAIGRNAMEALLDGPDDVESDIGMTSAIPSGTELLDIDIDGGEATVDLSDDFATGGGSLSMQLRVAQVVFTLTQFDTVDTVTILLDGDEATEGIGGEGVPAVGVDRTDVENVTPPVLVESPVPGEEVTSPITIAGIANTFEATVLYTVTDPEGLILAEGFTTATAGNGVWGDFEVTVEFTTERSGLGAVIVAQEDMESGGQRDVYEVPVRM
ncbi:MAG: GerMN domain-containing protein, partial [Acidimicrobiales bacterium]|nr:GerMN domain-containing protein [Acidimicrobiales bacterium]